MTTIYYVLSLHCLTLEAYDSNCR